MSRTARLRQLRELAGRLEQLPASEERDRMLRKVRERAVDVDTGVAATPLAAVPAVRKHPATAGRRHAEPACAASSPGWRSRSSRPTTSRDAGATLRSSDVLSAGELLSLEDLPGPAAPSPRPQTRAAWERGLRG